MVGIEIGVSAVAGHGIFKNWDGLFLGKEEATSKRLIAAWPGSHRIRKDG